jgi:hypothetical protein
MKYREQTLNKVRKKIISTGCLQGAGENKARVQGGLFSV